MANEFKIKKGLIVHGSGSSGDETVLDVQGNEGQLFSVTDQLSGSLFSVNDISGLPVLEAFSDDKVIMGSYGQNTLVVTGSKVGIGTDDPSEILHVEHGNIEIAAAAASAQGLYFSEDGNQKWSLLFQGGTTSNPLDIQVTDTTVFRILETGEVGIGVSSPVEKLEVDGNIDADDIYIDDWNSVSASLYSIQNGGNAGTVTEIIAGTGLSGGTITSTGTIDLSTATITTLGGIKLGSSSITTASTETTSTTANRTYGIQFNDSGEAVVNVPWTDTNTDTNTFRTVTAGGNTLGNDETLAFTAGTNVTITESGGVVTITSADTNTQNTKGISDGNVLSSNGTITDNDFLRINGTEVEGLTASEVRSAINVEDGATADLTATEIRSLVGTGNSGVIPATGTAGHFLKHDGTFGLPSYTTNTDTNTFRTVTAGGNTLGTTETLAFTAGTNVTIEESGGAVTINASSTSYTHPNHSGDVTSTGDGATSITANAVTHAKYQQIPTDTILGRTDTGAGDVTALTAANVRGIINVEDGATADLTATEIRSLVGTGNSGVIPATGTAGHFLKHDGTFGLPSYTTTLAFTSITSKPTTISGYGITDAFDGDYSNLTNTPTIPTNNNQLTNGENYITGYTVTEADVTNHESALEINYNQLTNTPTIPTAYTLPEATSTVRGGIELFSDTNQSIGANAVSATTGRTYGIQLNGNGQAVVNVPWVSSSYTLPTAISSTLGGIKLESNTVQNTTANSVSSTAGRTYGIQLNSSSQAVVNVPWENTNTFRTVTAGGNTLGNDETLTFTEGTNITITESGGAVTITATDTNTQNTKGISDGNVLSSNGTIADNDFLRINGTEVEGLTASEVRSAINVEDGANNYSLPEATSTVRGGIELFDDTEQSVTANTVSSTTGRTYGIQLNGDGQAVVNVPWVEGSGGVFLGGSFDYLTISGDTITRNAINLGTDIEGTLPVSDGGTGQTSYTSGQLLIGNTTGNTLTKATLTEGDGINITNGAGSITIAADFATSTVLGGIELFSDTVQNTAANSVSSTTGRTYGIQLNGDGQAVVNVPWVEGSGGGGSIDGSGASTRLAVWDDADTLTSDAGLTWSSGELKIKPTTNSGAVDSFVIENKDTTTPLFRVDDKGVIAAAYSGSNTSMIINDTMSNTPGANVTYIGYYAGNNNQGVKNTSIGASSGNASAGNLTGDENTNVGYQAGRGGSGDENVNIGSQAGYHGTDTTTDINNCVSVGYRASFNIGDGSEDNVAVGSLTLGSNIKATKTTALGAEAGDAMTLNIQSETTGGTFIGYRAGYLAKDAVNVICIGTGAGQANTYDGTFTTEGDTTIGYQAGLIYTQSTTLKRKGNVFLGSQAGLNINTGADDNVIIGSGAAANSTKLRRGNTIIGYEVGQGITTSTIDNTVIIGAGGNERLTIDSNGKYKMHTYGSGGTHTGSPVTSLGTDKDGNVFETKEYFGTFSGTTDTQGRITVDFPRTDPTDAATAWEPDYVQITCNSIATIDVLAGVREINGSTQQVTFQINQNGFTVSGYYHFRKNN